MKKYNNEVINHRPQLKANCPPNPPETHRKERRTTGGQKYAKTSEHQLHEKEYNEVRRLRTELSF